MNKRVPFWSTYLLYVVTLVAILWVFDLGLPRDWLMGLSNAPVVEEETPAISTKVKMPTYAKGIDEALLVKLKQGGLTIYLRHAHRTDNAELMDRVALSTEPVEGPFAQGACLDGQGKTEASIIGHFFTANAIPLGKIYSSPVCRASQTTLIAFSRMDAVTPAFVYDAILPDDETIRQARTEAGIALLKQAPSDGSNRIIVGHGNVLSQMGIVPKGFGQGDALILQHENPGVVPAIIGHITIEDFVNDLPLSLETRDLP